MKKLPKGFLYDDAVVYRGTRYRVVGRIYHGFENAVKAYQLKDKEGVRIVALAGEVKKAPPPPLIAWLSK